MTIEVVRRDGHWAVIHNGVEIQTYPTKQQARNAARSRARRRCERLRIERTNGTVQRTTDYGVM